MALSGVNSAPTPDEPKQGQLKSTTDNQDDKNYSIFDKDRDGTVTVKEQQDALRKVAAEDDIIKRAIEKGFDLDMYIQIFGELCEDIKTNTSQTIGKLIVTPQQMVAYANRTVQNLIDTIKEKANEYLQPKTEKTAPTNIGEGWGLEDEHMNYIYDKLQEKGIAPSKINIELLSDIMARYDYDMDVDSDGTLTTGEMNQYNDGVSHKYMDKDEQGNIKDTKVLDWIINKYLEKFKQ
jgi:hypothetical protein